MLPAAVKGLSLLLLLSLCSGCLVYTNRTSYFARTDVSLASTGATLSPVSISVHLQREPTAGVVPFAFTLREKGDYSFSVQFYQPKAQSYQGGVIQSFSIASPTEVLFQSHDSTFVHYVPQEPYPGPAKPYPDSFSRFYKTPYVIALADSSNHLNFTLDYILFTIEGKRQAFHLEQPLRVDRDKGVSLFSN